MFFNKKDNKEVLNKLEKISISLEKIVEIENSRNNETIKINKKSDIEILIERFYKLFKLHDISESEIPQVIDKKFNITIYDISSKENILKKIDIELLEWLSEFFGINLDWLINRSEILYKEQNFDKFEMTLFRFINSLSKENNFLIDLLRTKELKKNNSNNQEQLIYPIIRVPLINLTNRTIYKNILINDYIWDYQRSRLDFKTIIYMLKNGYVDYYSQKIYMNGYNMNNKVSHYDFIKGLISYEELKDSKRSQTWYPSDYIENDSKISLENDELVLVLEQIKRNNLIELCKDHLDFWNKQNFYNDYKTCNNDEGLILDINERNIIVYTEGKTDIIHIENAWKKLFNKEHNFNFISFDGIEKLASHISSSNDKIEKQISNEKIIAIFDSDNRGLNKFKKLTGKDPSQQFALAKNSNNIFIVLLPVNNPELNGLCEIEFLYPRYILEKYEMLEGKKELNELLKLTESNSMIALEILQKLNLNERVENLKYYKIIESRKNKFAQEIQSDINIKIEELINFKQLFILINKVLDN
jgi:transcriptional regulator with XRE-family HTH domain